MKFAQQWLYYFFCLWIRILYRLGLYIPPVKPKTFLQENSEYTSPLKTRFLTTFYSTIDYNENISPLFYNKSEFKTYMMESNTPLEKTWRTRILFENTPRGNVIMFYDAYKLGFSFYCDQKVISYDVLNAIAMKYVSMYRCRNFFLDENIVPKEYTSPLIALYFTDEPQKKTFVQPRNHPNKKPPQQEPEKKQNTFLYLGKTTNFQMTQPQPKPRKVLAKFVSPLLETLGSKAHKLSYKDFKQIQSKSHQE